MTRAHITPSPESAPALRGVVGPGLRRDDVEGRLAAVHSQSVIPLKSGTHASLRLRPLDGGQS
jgi:hypothetical protein